ncbi:FkbM family methyltransferase [Modicisalibacter radicis]|uniref:FkbM family methyltransferase n=1 Tax=Halomonas sp. EAR18 TaxID=2518972 RepID=UPI00109D5710|nr:FkbM family methyltransferase [Halomonas sp. EAR18]
MSKPKNRKQPSMPARHKSRQGSATLSEARKLTQRQPDNAHGWKTLGARLHDEALFDEAIAALGRAHHLTPDDHEVYALTAKAVHKKGKFEDAVALLRKSLEIKPDYARAHHYLAYLLYNKDDSHGALPHIDKACELEPQNHEYLTTQGNILTRLHRYGDAISALEKAIAIAPRKYFAWNNLGNLMKDTGRLEKALHNYHKALEVNPGALASFSNIITTLHYHPGYGAADIFSVCKEWDARFAPASVPGRPVPSDLAPNRRLRIGMFSDGFRGHPVGWMITRALEHTAASEVEFYLYSTTNAEDPITDRLKKVSTKWLAVQHLPDAEFAQVVRDDKIDILIDLSGHNSGNKMLTMAMQPAPLLVKWVGGLINTMGIKTIDYLISDSVETPPGVDALYVEKLIRFPDDYVCYEPPGYCPDTQPLPALENGFITLGCFNNPTKVNTIALAEWARIMQQLPDSRLLLKGMQYNSEELCREFRDFMESQGIAADRLVIEGPSAHRELLNSYNRVDIALDPWPYSGGLTTCEAFMMGVPVVTLPGPTFAGRHSATHLVNAGMPELVVDSWAEYRERVIELASDLESLSTIRRHLRDVLLQSPVCDASRFAKHFTTAMRAIWQRYCEDRHPAALTLDKNGVATFEGEDHPVEILRAEPLEGDRNDFKWQFEGAVTVLDNGAVLASTSNADRLLQLGAFAMVAFDPASKVNDAERLKAAGELHHYPHVALGDGNQATLYACLEPSMSATLRPLQSIETLFGKEAGPRVLTELPISTIQLDRIEGLEAIDWLLLDNMNDSLAVLEHGEQALADTLLIQARVNFQPTHENQPELTLVSHWMARHGFRFYRLNDPEHLSHLPQRDDLIQQQATQLASADALYIPNAERMAALSDNQRMKLAFILHTVYGVKDLAHALISQVEEEKAQEYLREESIISSIMSTNAEAIPTHRPVSRAASHTMNENISEDIDNLLQQDPGSPDSAYAQGVSDNGVVSRTLEAEAPSEATTTVNSWELEDAIHVTDIGANPIDGTPPYAGLLNEGVVRLVGFEPQKDALQKLQSMQGPNETYLPYAVGTGEESKLYLCQASGMTSTLKPNDNVLNHFQGYPIWGKVKAIEEIATVRLDDIEAIEKIDWLKIDIQGGELNVFKNAEEKLKDTLIIQTEVNFISLYENQPLFAEIDQWMRRHGFMLHTLLEQRKRLYAPMKINNGIHQGINQLTTADAVYIKDINSIEKLPLSSRKKLAIILSKAYGSHDLAYRLMFKEKDFDKNLFFKKVIGKNIKAITVDN